MKIVLLVVLILLGLILLPFLFLFICGLFVDTRKQYERDSKFYRALLDGSTTVILWCLGVRYKISGEEKFPETGNFLYHRKLQGTAGYLCKSRSDIYICADRIHCTGNVRTAGDPWKKCKQ